MVPGRELESPHLAIHGPEPCASTNSATRASLAVYHYMNGSENRTTEIFRLHTHLSRSSKNVTRRDNYQNYSSKQRRFSGPSR